MPIDAWLVRIILEPLWQTSIAKANVDFAPFVMQRLRKLSLVALIVRMESMLALKLALKEKLFAPPVLLNVAFK